MSQEIRTCIDCVYYDNSRGYHQPFINIKNIPNPTKQFEGWCRLYPEKIPTNSNDWCGHSKPKLKKRHNSLYIKLKNYIKGGIQ